MPLQYETQPPNSAHNKSRGAELIIGSTIAHVPSNRVSWGSNSFGKYVLLDLQ